MKGKTFLQQYVTVMLGLLLCAHSSQAATSLQYTLPGSTITFGDSGRTVAMTFSNKATNTGQVSALYDKGTGAQPSLWQGQCNISLTGTLTIGQTLEYYLYTSQDGTTLDGAITANAALASSDKRRNLSLLGVIVIDQTTQNVTMSGTFRNIYWPTRYGGIVFWNATGISTETSTTKHFCAFTPMPIQMQAN